VISGAQSPAVRAAIVASAALLAFRFGRRPDFPTMILVAAGAMVLIDPRQVDALGFRLSVAASLALALVLPPMLERQRQSGLAMVVAATVAAQIATLPLLLPVFGSISLASLPANVVAAPLAAMAMPLAALAAVAGLVSMPLAEVVAAPALVVATTMLGVVDALGAPAGYVSVGVQPTAAAAAIGITAVAVLLTLSGDVARWSTRSGATRSFRAPAAAVESRLPQFQGNRDLALELSAGRSAVSKALAAAAPAIVAGEHPSHALGTDTDHAEEHPASEEDIHDAADDRQRGQSFA
jgi:ComEC/Rec2-related protein